MWCCTRYCTCTIISTGVFPFPPFFTARGLGGAEALYGQYYRCAPPRERLRSTTRHSLGRALRRPSRLCSPALETIRIYYIVSRAGGHTVSSAGEQRVRRRVCGTEGCCEMWDVGFLHT